jgi:DNA polymerase-3 subunit epsilon
VGKESISRHSARLMTALAKQKLKEWPHAGPVAIVERDEFGMLEDFHLFNRWRYLGCVRSEEALQEHLESARESHFDPDIYRAYLKYYQGSRLKLITLPAKN